MIVTWAPSPEEVAAHIPARTRATVHPGATIELGKPLGTFNERTQPTDEAARRHIVSAVSQVLGRIGTLPATPAHLPGMATVAAALRAAADIELAYGSDRDADRDADHDAMRDVNTDIYQELDRRAQRALDDLVAAIGQGEAAPSGQLLPQWSMPDPVSWGDTDL